MEKAVMEDRPPEAHSGGVPEAPGMPYGLILVSAYFLVSGVNGVLNIFLRATFDFGISIVCVIVGVGLLRRSELARKAAVILMGLVFVLSLLFLLDFLRTDDPWWSYLSTMGRRLPELSGQEVLILFGIHAVVALAAAVWLCGWKARSYFVHGPLPSDQGAGGS